MPEVDKFRIKTFKTPKEFSKWLEYNHDTEVELWLKIFKKGSGEESINWKEAVIEGLCWGWIDGVKKSLNSQAYLQRFTPRRLGSNWSKRNTEHVESLIKEGRMKEAGLKHIQAAKEDGRWEAAYAPPSEMVIPSDFLSALEANLTAKKNFEALSKTERYNILYSLQTAKKVETRLRRVNKFIELLMQK
jgi:uncharacterized protein YdeI (YjbR/CyaY-like superfamily)